MLKYHDIGMFIGLCAGIYSGVAYVIDMPSWIFALSLLAGLLPCRIIVLSMIEKAS